MLRVIHGLRISNRVNMVELRTKIKMMSVNQMSIYHTIMEVFNIIHNKSSEQISNKYSHHERHSLRKNTNKKDVSESDVNIPHNYGSFQHNT